MTMYSRRDYIAFAKIIKDNTIIDNSKMLRHNNINKATLISDLIVLFKKDNSLFDRAKFIDACDIEDK